MPGVTSGYRGARRSHDHARRGRKVDPKQRAAAYEKIAQQVQKDRPIVYLFHRNWLWAHNAKLTGLRTVPDGMVRVQGLRMN